MDMENNSGEVNWNNMIALLRSLVNGKIRLVRLQLLRAVAVTAGQAASLLIGLFVFFLFALFAALTFAFWISRVAGSYVAGFGATALVVLLLFLLLFVMRKKLFVDPVIKAMLQAHQEKTNTDEPLN